MLKAATSSERNIDGELSPLAHLKSAIPAIIIFLVAFCVTAAGLSLSFRANTQKPDMLILSPKLAHFKAYQENYNTVFLGTSRTFYHIVPDEVEIAAADAGCPGLSVFNFGVFGLNGAEQDWILREIQNTPNLQLQTLILEDPLPAERRVSDVTTERARYFHQIGLYRAYLSDILSFPESRAKQVFRAGIFAYGALYDLSGVGKSASYFFPPAEQKNTFSFDFARGGFEALGSIMNDDIAARRNDFIANPEKFFDEVASYDLGPESDPSQRARYHFNRLKQLEASGFNVGFFVSPDAQEIRRTAWVGKALSELDDEAVVLNYNQPDLYPELFDRYLWFDFSHLNEEGAITLSQKVGAQLCLGLQAAGAVN